MKSTIFYCWVTRLTKVESRPTPVHSRYLCHKFSPYTPVENWTSEAAVDEVEFTCQCQRCKRHSFGPWVRKIPWRRKWQPSPVFLPGKFHGQRSLVDYSPWGCKESDMSECTHTHTHTHIALPGKVEHCRLVPLKNCVSPPERIW